MFTFRVLKRLLKTRTAIVAASSFFGFLLCEFAVRWLPIGRFDKTTVGIVRANLTRGFEFVPNVSIQRWGVDWNTNSKGFRDYEHQTLKNGFRILVWVIRTLSAMRFRSRTPFCGNWRRACLSKS